MDPLEALSLAQLRRRTSAKWRRYPDDVLPLWVAEMDVPVADAVAAELHRAVEEGDTGYASGAATPPRWPAWRASAGSGTSRSPGHA